MRTESEILSQIENWAKGDHRVRAIILTGSRATRGARPDFLSDYDLALYVSDWSPFQDSDDWLNQFGPILIRWPRLPQSTFDNNWLTRLVLFEDGVRIDFQISETRPIDPDAYDNGYRVVVDKDAMTALLAAPTFTAFHGRKPSKDQFEDLVNEFWWDAIYVPKYLHRNELPFAKFMLDDALRYNHLHRLIEWHIGCRHDWAVNPGCRGKWFSRYLDKDTWEAYQGTFAGAGTEENWRAFFRMGDLFGRLAAEVAEHLGYPHRAELGRKVTEYAAAIRQTDKNLHQPPPNAMLKSHNNMNIRPYHIDDKKVVIDLWKACNLIVPWNNPEYDIERKLSVDPDLFLVGEVELKGEEGTIEDDTKEKGKKIVASVMGGYDGHRGWINYLAVHPQYRRMGFGMKIMTAVENRLKAKGCPKINLQVRYSNPDVISFYKAIGYFDDKVISLGKRLVEDEKFGD